MMLEEIRVVCPACAQEGLFPMHESVNVTLNPEEKSAVLDADLFTYRCPVCGTLTRVQYPFLYHDMQRRFILRCFEQDEEETEALNDLTAQSGLFDGTGYALRRVDSYEELIEKIAVFERELDDRAVEICKILLIRELAQEHPELSVRRALIDVRGEQIYTAFIDEDGDVFAVELPDDLYNRVCDLFGDVIEECTDDGFARIDSDWARETLRLAMLEF